jgi:hypothetical protein
MRFSPLPWAHVLIPKRPHAFAGLPGLILRLQIGSIVESGGGLSSIDLSKACPDHLKIHILVFNVNNTKGTIISVCAIILDSHILVQDHTGKVFRARLAEGLTWFMFFSGFLRCIDADQTDCCLKTIVSVNLTPSS